MTVREGTATTTVETPPLQGRVRSYVSLLRIRQWVKNAFVLAGLFFSDQLFEVSKAGDALAATIGFCFVSSAAYCFNDIIDRKADAAHPEKRRRPVANGTVSVREAAGLAIGLLVSAAVVLGMAGLPWQVHVIVASYVVLNALYSGGLKRLSLLDVVVIASGFVLRLEAGIYAVDVPPSSWIVLCTGLLSLFLAFAKRRSDLALDDTATRQALTGYTLPFIDQVLGMMGAATIVVYALFTVSDYAQQRFDAPLLYLTTFPVVLAILRYLQLVVVRGRYASPAELLIRDRPLQLVIVVWVALFGLFAYA